ncbi:MAG: RagB/SusD family nutrient uptake outer membrane protein [bacterium]
MKNHKLAFIMPVLLISLLVWSCTNLDENPTSQVTPDNFFQTEDELVSAVIPVYSVLRDYDWGDYMQLQEHSSDELFVPQRGGDWGDGGVWRQLQTHTWVPTLGFLNGAWSSAFRGVALANATLDNLQRSTSDSPLIPTFIGEVQFLRAFYYWWLIDEFGPVPIVTDPVTDPDNPPQQNTRQEVFDFIVQEVNAALPLLKDSFGAANYGRVTKGAAHTLLATVYLNAEVYTGSPMWNECVQECDAVINSGLYDLLPNYNDVFALENEGPGNVENIFVVAHNAEAGVGFFRQNATFHYNQLPNTPWNGFSVLEDFYNKFDTTDVRFKQILVGAQFVLAGPSAGEPAFDRNGNRLIFTPDSPLIGADEGNGPRILKWPIDPNQNGADAGNDLAIFRYSHVLLAKAEALFNLGNTGEALALVNQVRERDFEPDKPLATLTSDLILDERGFEFLWESFRRQDLIRHGRFLEPWSLKPADDGEFRRLFPIPQTQLDANPNLKQNPGY